MVLSRLTKITGPGVATDTNWVGNNADFTGITTTATSFNIGVTTIHSNLIEAHNIKSTGIITATGGSFSGNVTAVDGTFSGNISIAGTLTYEDVTNIDSVGIITAPAVDIDDFLDVGSNIKLGNAGVITATSFVGSGAALTGIDATAIKDSGGNVKIQAQASGAIHSGVSTFQDIDVDGHTNLDNVTVTGVITATSFVGSGAQLTGIAATTNVRTNSLEVSGVSTFTEAIYPNQGSYGSATAGKIKQYSNRLYVQGGTDGIMFANHANNRWQINSSGYFMPVTDSTFDIGDNTTRVRNIYADTYYGDGSNLTSLPAQATISNNADNRVITGGSGVNLNGEANLTFNGNALEVNNTSSNTAAHFKGAAGAGFIQITDSDDSSTAFIGVDGGALKFQTSGSSYSDKLRILSGGNVNIGSGERDQTNRLLNVYGGQTRTTMTSGGNAFEVFSHTGTGQSYGILCQGGTNSNDYAATFRNTSGTTLFRIRGDGKVGINEASNINAKLHIQHDALNENILYATRYNDQANDKPIFCVTESKMDGFVDSGLVIGTHNRSMRLGPVFDSNAGVTTSTAAGITINNSVTGASVYNHIGINTGRPANALVVKHSEPTIRLVNTSQPNAGNSGRIRFTEYDTDYQGAFIHYNGALNKFHLGTHSAAGTSFANDVNIITIDRDSGITTFRNNVQFHGNTIRVPTRTSDPGSGVTGDMYYNTSNNNLKIYSGTGWGGLQFAKGTQTNPATSPSDLGATGALAQYYFSPDGGTAFQNYACGALTNLGSIPSGGPSWVGNISSLVIIHKAQVGTTASMMMSRANYLKFIEESDNRTNNTNYIYWSVFDNGTLWGITRTRWTGITYSTWANAHGSTGVDNSTLNGTPVWDVWKTGSGTAGGTISTGSYTISNDNNLIRAVLPGDPHNGSTSNRGLHYKRVGSGEHYPWFNSSGNITDNGYFYPSSNYYMGTDSRYQHYLFLSDT